MSTYPPYMHNAPPPRPPGMSGTNKLLIGLGIGFGVLVVLCCGGVIALNMWMQNYAEESISEDPEDVIAATQEIVKIDVLEGLKPKAMADLKVPFTGQRFMFMVAYADEANNSSLMLCMFGEMFAGQDQQQMQQQMEQSMREQGMAQQQNAAFQDQRQRTIDVRGQPVPFFFATGKDPQTGNERLQVTGTFSGDSGPIMLMLVVDPEKYPEEAIVKMIETIE